MTGLAAAIIPTRVVYRDPVKCGCQDVIEEITVPSTGLAASYLLSHNALVPGVQRNRTWISTFFS